MKLHLEAVGCHLPYGITQYYLPLPTQMNTSRLNLSNPNQMLVLNFPSPEGWKAKLTQVTYEDGMPGHTWSPVQVLTQHCMAGSRTSNLLITSPTSSPLLHYDLSLSLEHVTRT